MNYAIVTTERGSTTLSVLKGQHGKHQD